MAKRESVWSWISDKVQRVTEAKQAPAAEMPEENPWLMMSGLTAERRGLDRTVGSPTQLTGGTSTESGAAPGWLSGDHSPYGFSDEDGTLKQVDGSSWRNAAIGKKSKQFVPTRTSPRWQGSDAAAVQKRVTRPYGSTWMYQSVCAVALIGGALYAHQGTTPLATHASAVFSGMFQRDYTQTALPVVQTFLDEHHISLPAIASLGGVRLHEPLSDATVATDYSTTHPEMVFTGTPGEAVLAAGSGTISRVTKLSGGFLVRIDHGGLGTTAYVGLADVSVHDGESVPAGEIIGHLANNAKPQLQFTLERQGHYVDPHDEIHFAGNGV